MSHTTALHLQQYGGSDCPRESTRPAFRNLIVCILVEIQYIEMGAERFELTQAARYIAHLSLGKMQKRCSGKETTRSSPRSSRTRLDVFLYHLSTRTRGLWQDVNFNKVKILWLLAILSLTSLQIMFRIMMTRPMTRKMRKSCCVWIFFAVLTTHGLATGDYCPPTQHVEIGKIGVIHCSFDQGSYVIMWYNRTDTRSERPIVVLQDSTKSGYGYLSQEYGIFANGSLLIYNVTTLHEKMFTVKRLKTPYSSARFSHIEVHAVVKPKYPRPIISPHTTGDGFDYMMLPAPSQLSCFVRSARPMVGIEWIYEETSELVTNQTSKILNDVSNLTYTSQQFITYPTERSPLLSLLKCQAVDSVGLLEETKSLILIEKWSNDSYSDMSVETLVRLNTEMSLDCFDGNDGDLVVWKKENATTKQFEVLAFAELQRYNLRRAFHDDYNLSSSASLSLPRADIKHEGQYLCISNTGVRGYEVVVAVTPTPPYLIVAGCSNQQYCVIDVERRGNLTCRVQRVRPPVQLEFIAVSGNTRITFRNIYTKVKIEGNLFDVIHTAGYVADLSLEKVTVECREKEPKQISLQLSRTRLDLFFPDSSTSTNGFKQGDTFLDKVTPWLFVMSLILQIVVTTMLTWFICKFKNEVGNNNPS